MPYHLATPAIDISALISRGVSEILPQLNIASLPDNIGLKISGLAEFTADFITV